MGLVAYYYADILKEVAAEFHVEVGRIEKSPMPGLVRYHTANCRFD
jgi:hypothetical protein